MKSAIPTSVPSLRIGAALAAALALSGFSHAADLVPLKLVLPKPVLVGTPLPLDRYNVEHLHGKRPDLMVPVGTVNLALHKNVTSSDPEPVVGDLSLVTDGEKGGEEGNYVELGPGKQWVQIDLGQAYPLYAVAVWHYHSQARVYLSVVVQVSDDPDFIQNVTTLFNNDADNRLGLGAGKDPLYIETYEGRLIDAKGIKGRYVRLYSRGNSSTEMNHYIEVEVYGKPGA
jgi:hypothetical protein